MRWKELLIGAAMTLTVTVIGGLLVYFFTQEDAEPRNEVLRYQIEEQVSFVGNENRFSIGTLKFANVGNEPAENLRAQLKTPGADIVEFNISSENGLDVERSISGSGDSITLEVDSLLPDEIVTVTYLLDHPSTTKFSIRSGRSIGAKGAIYRTEKERRSILNDFLGDFVPLLIVFAFIPLVLILKYLRSSISRGSSKNNTAFVMLHKGAVDEARSLLEDAVHSGEDGSHALSNYASALAAGGDTENAKKYIDAAEFLARTKHERAVCRFNNAIVQFQSGDLDGSRVSLQEALKLSKSEILFYIKSSNLLSDIVSRDEKTAELVARA